MAAIATPSDVKIESGSGGVIATDLSDTAIQSYIDDAYFSASQAIDNYGTEYSDEYRRQLEKYLAALYVRVLADKPISSTSRESASVDYEGSQPTIASLRWRVNDLDPSGSLAYNIDGSRFVSSTNES